MVSIIPIQLPLRRKPTTGCFFEYDSAKTIFSGLRLKPAGPQSGWALPETGMPRGL